MRENADQNNSEYGYISLSVEQSKCLSVLGRNQLLTLDYNIRLMKRRYKKLNYAGTCPCSLKTQTCIKYQVLR